VILAFDRHGELNAIAWNRKIAQSLLQSQWRKSAGTLARSAHPHGINANGS
jgi:hypothetical protein